MKTRDQQRALHAYQCVGAVDERLREDYKVAVNGLGPNVIRSGLAGAVAFLERQRKRDAVKLFLDHLGKAQIPGLENKDHRSLPDAVRGLDLAGYMLASRETLRVAQWFKRAVQATFGED